jgi:hypothetical protein
VAKYTFRFESNANGARTISAANLLDLLNVGFFNLTDNEYTRVIEAIKLRRVRIWGAYPIGTDNVSGRPQTIGLQWYGNQYTGGRNVVVSDTGIGTVPPYVTSTPPPGSAASQWQQSNTAISSASPLFSLGVGMDSIVDLECDVVFVGDSGSQRVPVSTASTVSAPLSSTQSDWFYKSLDGGATPLFPSSAVGVETD